MLIDFLIHRRFRTGLLTPGHKPPIHHCKTDMSRLTLLLANTDGTTSSTSSLGMLTSDTQAPVVSQTTMGSDLLQTFQIFTQFAFHAVCQHLGVLAIDDVALSVKEPFGDLVLGGVLDDCDNSLEFFGCDFAGAAFFISPSLSLQISSCSSYRLFKSTSAFLHTKLE